MTVEFDIKYIADMNNTKTNQSVNIVLKDLDGYDGECAEQFELISIDFRTDWNLKLNYSLINNAYYELNSIMFHYVVDRVTFPNSTVIGPQTILIGNMTQFSASKDNSYKCFAKTLVDLSDDVKLEFTNYQAQPFLGKSSGFDTAVECSADTTGTSKLVPIIVGSALAVLVIMVLIAYVIGRRKHRPGYVQV
jgi:lysosomal-associated membrane protein 1/2